METLTATLPTLTDPEGFEKLRNSLDALPGTAIRSLKTGRLEVQFDALQVSAYQLTTAIERAGFRISTFWAVSTRPLQVIHQSVLFSQRG